MADDVDVDGARSPEFGMALSALVAEYLFMHSFFVISQLIFRCDADSTLIAHLPNFVCKKNKRKAVM